MESGGTFKSRIMPSAIRDSLPSFLISVEDFKNCFNKYRESGLPYFTVHFKIDI